jgi:hypothetical protein
MIDRVPFHYDNAFYNDLCLYIEQNWNCSLTQAEKDLAKYAYRIGRLVEMESNLVKENVIKVIDGVAQIYFNNPEHVKVYERWIED